MSILVPKSKAPDFSLPSTVPNHKTALSDFKGKPVVIAFYPADWSPVCSDQLNLYNEIMPEFRKHNAELLAISVDNVWSHLAFKKNQNFHFQLLSDFEPKGKIAKEYGAYESKLGIAQRALFVIDPEGIIQWSYLSPIGVNPGADGILTALEQLPRP